MSAGASGNTSDVVEGDIRIPDFSPDIGRPIDLLDHCPAYRPTECRRVDIAGIGVVFLKDETDRMSLGSFKALGGVYAVAMLIADEWHDRFGTRLAPSDYDLPEVRTFANTLTFVCASAGNHGLAVAAGAKIFGAHARIYLSDTVPGAFAGQLLAKGAEVVRAGSTYEDSVDAASDNARSTNSILLADSSWQNYWRAPSLVMEGYSVLADELRQFFESGNEWPTHVFLQAGVGGVASAVATVIRKDWRVQPQIVIVEPDAAPCLKVSAKIGRPTEVSGPVSNMGRLDCKVPSLLAYKSLMKSDVSFMTVTDDDAVAAAAKLLALDMPSTPSGAAGLAGLVNYAAHENGDHEMISLVIVTEKALD